MLLSWLEIGPIKAFEHYTKATSSANTSLLSANEKLEERHKFLSKSLSVSYEQPLYLKGQPFNTCTITRALLF